MRFLRRLMPLVGLLVAGQVTEPDLPTAVPLPPISPEMQIPEPSFTPDLGPEITTEPIVCETK